MSTKILQTMSKRKMHENHMRGHSLGAGTASLLAIILNTAKREKVGVDLQAW